MSGSRQGAPVVLVCNSAWYAWNFRANTIRALLARGYSVIVIAPPDETVPKIKAIGGASFQPWRVSIDGHNPLREAASLLVLSVMLRRVRPALVFSFTIKPNVYAGLVCRMLAIPYAPNVTGLGMVITTSGYFGRLLGRLYAFACSSAKRIFVQNMHDLAVLRALGLRASIPVVTLKGSGVDLSRFESYPMPSAPPCAFVFIGRLQEDKGVREFVEAARRLNSEGIPARFTVVGGTRHTNASMIPATDLDTWRREELVELVGAQEDVRPWLQRAHTLVVPSHGGEGIPRVVLEAAAVGRPAIVSDVPGCRDAVIDHETGLVCPARDPATLADTMRTFAELPPDRIAKMGCNARRLAEKCFSEESVINEYIDCVEPHYHG